MLLLKKKRIVCGGFVAELQVSGVQPHVGVHELAQARLRAHLRRGHPARAPVQGQVRAAHRVAQKRLRQRAQPLRHHEGIIKSSPNPKTMTKLSFSKSVSQVRLG